jgi:hypothetical protein
MLPSTAYEAHPAEIDRDLPTFERRRKQLDRSARFGQANRTATTAEALVRPGLYELPTTRTR